MTSYNSPCQDKQLDKLMNFLFSEYYIPYEELREIPAPIGKEAKYEGRYFASSLGRIISLYFNDGKPLSQFNQEGYYKIDIFGEKNVKVSHLVATAFIPNPENKPIVHHKDRNPLNNKASNLQWVTEEEHKEIHRHANQEPMKAAADEVLLS